MTDRPAPLPLIIGIGNEMRGDDGAGAAAARRLDEKLRGKADVELHWGEGAALMRAWEGRGFVILIDAARSGAPAGVLHRFDAAKDEIPAGFLHYSTHRFGVAEAVALARQLNRLPEKLLLFAIEGERFTLGAALSPAVERAVEQLSEEVAQLVNPGHG